MTKLKSVILGIIITTIGIIILLNVLGIANLDLFFKGWWTLFIIIPCFIGLFDKGDKTGDIIGIVVGVALLLACQEIIDFGIIWKLALPALLIIIGLSIIFKSIIPSKTNKKINILKKESKNNSSFKNEHCAIFSGHKFNFSGEVFNGARFSAVFGGIDCDLRNAIIEKDVLIEADAIFGGVDIFVPQNVKVKIKSNSIFGGASNKATFTGDENSPTVYVNTNCIFGGLDVK